MKLTASVMDNKACKGDMIGFNCSADANPSVTSYQLFENDSAILATNLLGMWKRNVSTGGVFVYKCMANNSVGSEVSSFVMVTVNGKVNFAVLSNCDSFSLHRFINLQEWEFSRCDEKLKVCEHCLYACQTNLIEKS